MQLSGATVLVTGANRGIGAEFARQLVERGAKKVYAAARNPLSVTAEGVEAIALDITDPASVAAAAAKATDVDIVINNAGISTGSALLGADLTDARREMDTHFWGTLEVVRHFAPVLESNGGGAILNVLSALSWFSVNGTSAYSAAKAAEWSLTNSVRLELSKQNTLVTGLILGAADTDMTAGYDGEKSDPADIVRAALAGIEENKLEVLADDWSRMIKATLANDPSEFYAPMLTQQ